MRSTMIPGGVRCLAISSAIVCLLILNACGNRAGNQVENKNAGADRNERSAVAADSASRSTSGAPTKDQAIPGTTQTRNNHQSPVTRMPTTQIGTGGSDFFLFTQARAALESDADLNAANIVIDVKAGLLKLNGTVANADQKSKAEQLVRVVQGVKAVKNELRISVAKSASLARQPG